MGGVWTCGERGDGGWFLELGDVVKEVVYDFKRFGRGLRMERVLSG